ncbi:MAG: calcium/sodium antiporter [Phycisphaerae bacterium]|nr:calcium/sodium antiporter [Phycisphaerae bacterium]
MLFIYFLVLIAGFILLIWSADRFVEGAAATARHFGMSPLLVGMVIVGFGTSAPEMLVSASAALDNAPGLAIGNAYGSNIANIALILGVTALVCPIAVHSRIFKKELPLLTLLMGLAAFQAMDKEITRTEAYILLAVLAGLLYLTIHMTKSEKSDRLAAEFKKEIISATPLGKSVFTLVYGLILLCVSSKWLVVWPATSIAEYFGVSETIIGLTVVAIGTSLPELASSIVAARKGEHDIAIGNVLGSNVFNTLAVVGIAGAVVPASVDPAVPAFLLEPSIYREAIPIMFILTVSLFVLCYGFKGKPGRINRFEGAILLSVYLAYTGYLIHQAVVTRTV